MASDSSFILHSFPPGFFLIRRVFTEKPSSDAFFDMVQIFTLLCGEKTEGADLDEAFGQDMLQDVTRNVQCFFALIPGYSLLAIGY